MKNPAAAGLLLLVLSKDYSISPALFAQKEQSFV